MASTSTSRDQINLRASSDQRSIIDRAAELSGLTRTDFILTAAVREAEHVIVDRAIIRVSDDAFHQILELIDNPPPPNEELITLLRDVAKSQ